MIWILLAQASVIFYAWHVVSVATVLDENEIEHPYIWGLLWPLLYFNIWRNRNEPVSDNEE